MTRNPAARASISSEMSLDCDLLSISNNSEDDVLHLPKADDVLYPVIIAAAEKLLRQYLTYAIYRRCTGHGQCSGSSGSASGGNTGKAGTAESSQPSQTSASKRKQRDTNDEDWDEDGFKKPPLKRSKQIDTQKGMLACPFWKSDPTRYHQCFSLKLHGISRVKQHLIRKHMPAYYCQRCLMIFPDSPLPAGARDGGELFAQRESDFRWNSVRETAQSS